MTHRSILLFMSLSLSIERFKSSVLCCAWWILVSKVALTWLKLSCKACWGGKASLSLTSTSYYGGQISRVNRKLFRSFTFDWAESAFNSSFKRETSSASLFWSRRLFWRLISSFSSECSSFSNSWESFDCRSDSVLNALLSLSFLRLWNRDCKLWNELEMQILYICSEILLSSFWTSSAVFAEPVARRLFSNCEVSCFARSISFWSRPTLAACCLRVAISLSWALMASSCSPI